MDDSYKHTQPGYLLLAILAGVLPLLAAASLLMHMSASALIFGPGLVVLSMLLLSSLTTVVSRDRLLCYFGPGLIRRTIALRDITDVSIVHNSLVYGIGLRLIPNGWLWNVAAGPALELKLKSGRVFRIGTNEPEALKKAIASGLSAT